MTKQPVSEDFVDFVDKGPNISFSVNINVSMYIIVQIEVLYATNSPADQIYRRDEGRGNEMLWPAGSWQLNKSLSLSALFSSFFILVFVICIH